MLTQQEYEKIYNTIKDSDSYYYDYQITFTFEELKKATQDGTIIETLQFIDKQVENGVLYEELTDEIEDELSDAVREITAKDICEVE